LCCWSDEEIEYLVADSLALPQFCRVYPQPVPGDTTLLRWAHLIGAQALAMFNDCVVALVRSPRVTRGGKLQVDSMVVEMSSWIAGS
jgi:hypothetical protein